VTSTPKPLRLPSWLLMPGLIALLVSVGGYLQLVRFLEPSTDPDIHVYAEAGAAWRTGENVYALLFADHVWPFTYPPVTLLFFGPLSTLGAHGMLIVLDVLSVVALVACVYACLSMARIERGAGFAGGVALISALVLWLDPILSNIEYGQVNILLMALVLLDFRLSDRRPYKGVLTAVAASVKLVPGIFIAYALVTRRWRMALVSLGTFLTLQAIGFLASPSGSVDYWLRGEFADSSRVAQEGPATQLNQSLHALALRLLPAPSVSYAVLAAAVLAAGLVLAMRAHRAGQELAGVTIIGLTSLLISPVSWHYHWTWIVPAIVCLAVAAASYTGRAAHLAAALPAVLFALFLAWPMGGASPGVAAPRGLVWFPPHLPLGLTRIEAEIYNLAAIALLALAWWWLRRRKPVTPAVTATEPAVARTESPTPA
jgi:alpha-1,2-mannosyltransferase